MAQYKEKDMLRGERFDSLDEMVATLERRKADGSYQVPAGMRQEDECRPDWHGCESGEQANEWARYGWPEGSAMAQRMDNELGNVSHFETTKKMAIGYVGGCPVIPAYLAGAPQHMVDPAGKAEYPVVRVVVNIGFLAEVSTQTKEAKGIAIMALVKRLEDSGKRVELIAWKGTRLNKGWAQFGVRVKAASESADMGRLAYVLAHPSFMRVHNFSWLESWHDAVNNGYGSTLELTSCELTDDIKPDFYIRSVKSNDPDSPLAQYRNLKAEAIKAGLLVD